MTTAIVRPRGRSVRRETRTALRDELAALHGDGVGELQAQARRRHRGAPRANLMMADAY
jgi:hypothetical protein